MKKTYLFIALVFASFLFIECSSDDDNKHVEEQINGTLFVNGENFALGTNASGNILNSMTSGGAGDLYTTTFTIAKSTTNPLETDVITIAIVKNTNTDINGTYNFIQEDGDTTLLNYAVGNYFSIGNNRTYGDGQASGTVKVTKIGIGNYKLEFDNAKFLHEQSNDTKTLTGYCELEFEEF